MGCSPERIFGCRSPNLLIFWILLLITSWNRVKIIAEGRAIPKLVEGSSRDAIQKKTDEELVVVARFLIGSRPPRCERRCSSCGHCEAVQVPIVPSSLKQQQQQTRKRRSHDQFFATPTIAYSRGDGISNYKPMCWKCKCGNFMFNP